MPPAPRRRRTSCGPSSCARLARRQPQVERAVDRAGQCHVGSCGLRGGRRATSSAQAASGSEAVVRIAAGACASPRAPRPRRRRAIASHHRAVLGDAPGASCGAFSKWLPSCSNSGLLRSSNSSVTTRSSAALSLASAMRDVEQSRSPRIGITPARCLPPSASTAVAQALRPWRWLHARAAAWPRVRDSISWRARMISNGPSARVDLARRARPRLSAVHVDARAHAHLDQALDLERDQRLAHRGPRHAELRAPGHARAAGASRARIRRPRSARAAGRRSGGRGGAARWFAGAWAAIWPIGLTNWPAQCRRGADGPWFTHRSLSPLPRPTGRRPPARRASAGPRCRRAPAPRGRRSRRRGAPRRPRPRPSSSALITPTAKPSPAPTVSTTCATGKAGTWPQPASPSSKYAPVGAELDDHQLGAALAVETRRWPRVVSLPGQQLALVDARQHPVGAARPGR